MISFLNFFWLGEVGGLGDSEMRQEEGSIIFWSKFLLVEGNSSVEVP